MNSGSRNRSASATNNARFRQTGPTRRNFLRGVLGATAIGALAEQRSWRFVHAAETNIIRVGLIGCGGRGSGAVRNLLDVEPAARLVAMSDAFRDRAEAARARLAKQFPQRVQVDDDHIFDGFDGYKHLLASGVDVALLAEPPHFRPAHIEACVEAGVHLFAEKPMAVDAPGVRRVLAAGKKAKEKNLSFVSGFETRYNPIMREAVRRIHDGQIGEVLAIQGTYNIGDLWHRGRQPEWTEMEYQMRNWYYFTWLSGDHIVEQHVHFMDLVCWIMNEQPPLNAWGYGGRAVRTEPKYGDIFDHHAVVFEYSSGTRVYAFTRQQRNCWREVSYLVIGSKGKLQRGKSGWGTCVITGENPWESGTLVEHPERNCFREMMAGIRNGNPINDSFSMANSTMLAILGRMATYSGQLVSWEEGFNSQLSLGPKDYRWDADPPVLPGPDGRYPHAIPGITKAY